MREHSVDGRPFEWESVKQTCSVGGASEPLKKHPVPMFFTTTSKSSINCHSYSAAKTHLL